MVLQRKYNVLQENIFLKNHFIVIGLSYLSERLYKQTVDGVSEPLMRETQEPQSCSLLWNNLNFNQLSKVWKMIGLVLLMIRCLGFFFCDVIRKQKHSSEIQG